MQCYVWLQLYCWFAYIDAIVKLINPAVLLDKMYVLFSSTVLLDKQLVAPCSASCTIR